MPRRRGKSILSFNVGDRFRASGGSKWMPYRDKEIVVVGILNPRHSMYLMAADGEHFEAHRDWLSRYWEKINSGAEQEGEK